MIFQDPMTSLNPVKKVRWQLEEAVLVHHEVDRSEARRRALEVLEEIRSLQSELHMAMILVTHDLGVVAETCERAIVMYCGVIVEVGATANLFSRPHHPYAVGLLKSIPRIRERKLAELPVIPGRVPDLLHLPRGCRFADRCPRVTEQCRAVEPALTATAEGGLVACHHPHA